MLRRFVRPLTPAESRRIEDLFRTATQPSVRRRANAVRLSALGHTVRQIMKAGGLVFERPRHTLKGRRDEDAFAAVRGLPDQFREVT